MASPLVPSLPSSLPDTPLYSDPLYLTRSASPYYQKSHYRLQRELRAYVDTHISPFCEEWEANGSVPEEALRRHAELGYAAVSVYPLATEYLNGQRLPADIKASEWDGFHDLIFIDEIARCGYLGVIWGLSCGNSIGAPPLVNYGSVDQKRVFMPYVLQGRSRFCLGVTEPDGNASIALHPNCAKIFQRDRMSPPSPRLPNAGAITTL
jgi:alkylation response protein AidB-like acyl-CoA dehydrogenase